MNELVKINKGKLMTTTKLIADYFGKAHRDVTRALENMDCSQEFRDANYVMSSYTSPQNKILKCFNVSKDGFYFLAMGFTGGRAAKFKEGFIVAFNEMEKGLLNVDAEMTRLSNQGKEIKLLGSEWSKFGHQINNQKKSHEKSVNALINKVQLKLDFKDQSNATIK